MVSPVTRTRSSLPATAQGTSVHAYTLEDWSVLAVIALIWGSSFLFMEIGLRSFAPGVVTMVRIALGVGTLALFARARAPVDREDWGRLALLGTVWTAIPLTLFPIAQQWIDSSVAGMINGAMPIFAVAWATYLLRRLPGWRQLVGIGIGFLGILLVFVPELQASATTALGAILALAAVFFYGLATNLAVPLQQKYGSPPVVLRSQLFSLLLVLPWGLWQLAEFDLVVGVGAGDGAAGRPGDGRGHHAHGHPRRTRGRAAGVHRHLLPAHRGRGPGRASCWARRSRRWHSWAWPSSWPAPGSPHEKRAEQLGRGSSDPRTCWRIP